MSPSAQRVRPLGVGLGRSEFQLSGGERLPASEGNPTGTRTYHRRFLLRCAGVTIGQAEAFRLAQLSHPFPAAAGRGLELEAVTLVLQFTTRPCLREFGPELRTGQRRLRMRKPLRVLVGAFHEGAQRDESQRSGIGNFGPEHDDLHLTLLRQTTLEPLRPSCGIRQGISGPGFDPLRASPPTCGASSTDRLSRRRVDKRTQARQ